MAITILVGMEDLIGTVEAAEVLGVERSVLTRWVQTGRLPEAIKLPGATGARLFRRSDVEALAKASAS